LNILLGTLTYHLQLLILWSSLNQKAYDGSHAKCEMSCNGRGSDAASHLISACNQCSTANRKHLRCITWEFYWARKKLEYETSLMKKC